MFYHLPRVASTTDITSTEDILCVYNIIYLFLRRALLFTEHTIVIYAKLRILVDIAYFFRWNRYFLRLLVDFVI